MKCSYVCNCVCFATIKSSFHVLGAKADGPTVFDLRVISQNATTRGTLLTK